MSKQTEAPPAGSSVAGLPPKGEGPRVNLPPPPGPRSDHHTPWESQAGAYLLSRGWQKVLHVDGIHASWYDSLVHDRKPELRHTKTIEGRDGTSEVLMQWHAPPVPWGFSLDEAVAIQTERDTTPEGIQLQIEHKRKELEALEELATKPVKTGGGAK